MPFQFVSREDLSLNDLLALEDSCSVVKTPHVGNCYPNNLLVARAGIPVQLYDRTLGCKDTNFHPHTIIKDGVAQEVGPDDVMLTHASVQQTHPAFPDIVSSGRNLAAAHAAALSDALPSADISIFSEYLKSHADLVRAVLAAIFPHNPDLWTRYVGTDGRVRKRQPPATFSRLARAGIYGVNDQESGWIIPNELNLLVDAVIQIDRLHTDADGDFGRADLYHLSGPDMIEYIGSDEWHLKDMSGAYDVIRDTIDVNLPEYIHFHIVPVSSLRFAVPEHQKKALQTALRVLLRIREFNRRNKKKRRQWYSDAFSKQTPLMSTQKKQLIKKLRSALQACPSVFYDIESADYFSQYDMLDGRQLFVPDIIYGWSMEMASWAEEKFFKYRPS